MKKVFVGVAMGFLLGWITPSHARAGQNATVSVESVEVHERPSSKSPLIKSLLQGAQVRVSFKKIPDDFGVFWYKVRVEPGKYGYAESEGFRTAENARDLRGGGISQKENEIDDDESPWLVALRGMALVGTRLSPSIAQYGGEVELSFCIPFEAHGYLHRFMAAGPVFVILNNDSVVGGSVIFRFYQEDTMIEPELRVRGGLGTLTQNFYGGLNIGVRYPFSNNAGVHLSGYTELGTLTTLDFSAFTLWGAVGVGFHF